MINEFGTLGVDGNLIPPGKYHKYEINRGSIFCTCTRTDFLATLRKVAASSNCDHLLIEATGIAETGDLFRMIEEPSLARIFQIHANICLVDALNSRSCPAIPDRRRKPSCCCGRTGCQQNRSDIKGRASKGVGDS